MNRKYSFLIYFFAVFIGSGLFTVSGLSQPLPLKTAQPVPLKENQILYNGKVWRNLYTQVKGDQFLLTKDFLPASLTIYGKTYNDVSISYDIYNDELITPTNHGSIIQLNKEMIDSFRLDFQNSSYKFINTDLDSLEGVKGYVNVLYEGRSALFIKYRKEIDLLAVDDKYDLFFQTKHIFLMKGKKANQINNKNDLFKIFYEKKTQIKDFMKKNKLKVSRKEPTSFIPVIRYYDSLSQ